MKIKWIFFAAFCLMILFVSAGCKEVKMGYAYVIDEEIRGKWEAVEDGNYGWLIEERTVTRYNNGEIEQKHEGVYSENLGETVGYGNNFAGQYAIYYIYENPNPLFYGDDGLFGLTVFFEGDNLRIDGGYNWKKVDNFRWEGK